MLRSGARASTKRGEPCQAKHSLLPTSWPVLPAGDPESGSYRVPRHSAGLLVYRPAGEGIEVLAVHPGGPFWAKKDNGAWSIPKGEVEPSEQQTGHHLNELDPEDRFPDHLYAVARREFSEEIGSPPPDGDPMDLGEIRQAGGKIVHAFALRFADDSDDANADRPTDVAINSNLVELEWPRGTGRILTFPEVDKAQWMSPEAARAKLVPSQVAFVDRLLELLGA